ncbi:hypothetical protein HZH68_016133 [Vespula germanica]|uniref:Uncharacterized protein n=1 Tax=Vespula germanica TaxID=30212 RepID=A0A834MSG1_VESGE|nr:hypothetical protein HZH68_016133 [Vespula germanica]
MGGILDLALNSKIIRSESTQINSDNISGFKNVTEDDEMNMCVHQKNAVSCRDDPICRPSVCLADLLKQRKKGHWKAADTVCKWDDGGFLTWTLECKCDLGGR